MLSYKRDTYCGNVTEALAGNMTVEDAAKAVVEAVQPMADEAAG